MVFEKFERVCLADDRSLADESQDGAGTDPNSGGKKEDETSGVEPEGSEKLFTETQVNKIVQARLERERSKVDKEVEGRLKTLGLENLQDAQSFSSLQKELEELKSENSLKISSYESIIQERERKFDEELRAHEADKKNWRLKYETLRKRAELTETALKAGADPGNVDMIVTFTEGSLRVSQEGAFKVVDKGGGAMLDPDTGTEITLEKFMKNFLSERPGLVKAASARGAGTGALTAKSAKYTIDEIKDIAKADPKKYAELKQEGIVQAVYDRHLSLRR
jgi:hypothetical protein